MARFDLGSDMQLLSRPCPVRFAGWETTTARLQQAGWQLSMEQDILSGRLRLIMRFEPCQMYMLAEDQSVDFFDKHRKPVLFNIYRAFCNGHVVLHDDFRGFQPVDAMPQMVAVTKKSIEDFKLFATPLTRTEEIIVEPDTVADLMDKIRKLQAPELADIRERNRRRATDPGSSAPIQAQNFHAQIISLAA